ncbi:MAG: hypothetical protein GOP50_12770 [Candidatus Heimdallarchaeota archaeon]|nr:hypothetical protein [Candidatus Heimdallarchaeota archaeon]
MALNALYYTIGAVLIGTAVFAIIVAISARKIDFGDRLFNIRDRRKMFRESYEVGTTSKRKAKGRRSKSARPQTLPSSSEPILDYREEEREKIVFDEESEEDNEDALTGPSPGSGYAPKSAEIADYKKSAGGFDDELEMAEEAEMIEEAEVVEAIEIKEEAEVLDDMSRDLSIQLPKNMCLDEVFRLKVTLIKSEKFKDELTIKELELDKKEAEYFSLNVTKLGEKVTEATTRIEGLSEDTLIVRPIAIGNVAVVSPSQRTVFFDPSAEEIVVEFFLTPTRWSKELVSNLRLEFEQHFKIIKAVNIPIKIYKHKLEAIFGINISRWQYYSLFVYSALGTISGLISFFNEKVVEWFNYLSSL